MCACGCRYLTEIFPTSVRSTAFGLAMGLGRSGGVLSSGIGNAFESMKTPFQLYAASLVVGGVLVSLFSVETAHRPLADTMMMQTNTTQANATPPPSFLQRSHSRSTGKALDV